MLNNQLDDAAGPPGEPMHDDIRDQFVERQRESQCLPGSYPLVCAEFLKAVNDARNFPNVVL
jgi:hypothetical protein